MDIYGNGKKYKRMKRKPKFKRFLRQLEEAKKKCEEEIIIERGGEDERKYLEWEEKREYRESLERLNDFY